MIDYIRGRVARISPTEVTLDVGGIGYALLISLTTFDKINGMSEAELLVYENIKEDSWTLYGFASEEERELFKSLISVSGVGAMTARLMLSSMQPAELASLIVAGDSAALRRIKGIGTRTSERIVVELKDRLGTLPMGKQAGRESEASKEAVQALVALGFQLGACQRAVQKVEKAGGGQSTEELIKRALQELRG